jgi:hypothetical protein
MRLWLVIFERFYVNDTHCLGRSGSQKLRIASAQRSRRPCMELSAYHVEPNTGPGPQRQVSVVNIRLVSSFAQWAAKKRERNDRVVGVVSQLNSSAPSTADPSYCHCFY